MRVKRKLKKTKAVIALEGWIELIEKNKIGNSMIDDGDGLVETYCRVKKETYAALYFEKKQ